jgi:hypothetical protein
VQPAVEVVPQRAGAEDAEAVLFPQTVNLNYNVTHLLKAESVLKSRNHPIKRGKAPDQKLPGEVGTDFTGQGKLKAEMDQRTTRLRNHRTKGLGRQAAALGRLPRFSAKPICWLRSHPQPVMSVPGIC